MIGFLAASKAGHDKGEIYIIIKEENEFVYLSDGIGKTVSSPKKKNKKHIQIIKNGLDTAHAGTLAEQLKKGVTVKDEEIKYFIKQYKKSCKQ